MSEEDNNTNPNTTEDEEQKQQEDKPKKGTTFLPTDKKDKPLPRRFQNPDILKQGYGKGLKKSNNPLYRSTLSDIGAIPPTAYEMPDKYYPKGTTFSNSFNAMYKSNGLNTSMAEKKPPNEFDLALF